MNNAHFFIIFSLLFVVFSDKLREEQNRVLKNLPDSDLYVMDEIITEVL